MATIIKEKIEGGLPEFIGIFKKMLVCRYNWRVEDAANYSNQELESCFNGNLSEFEAYYKIFNVMPDLVSQITT